MVILIFLHGWIVALSLAGNNIMCRIKVCGLLQYNPLPRNLDKLKHKND
jgi:hypothetical protein